MTEQRLNPYAAGVVSNDAADTDTERMRKMYLSHEASVKSIWVVFAIGAFICGTLAIGFLTLATRSTGALDPTELAVQMAIGVALLFLAIAYIVVGSGVGSLAAWSKIPATILAGIGLLFFPIGTLINGYVLYLLLSRKATMVFSVEYREVVQQTPHIRFRTTAIGWVVLGMILLIVGLGLLSAFIG